jgi:hypothetical protein
MLPGKDLLDHLSVLPLKGTFSIARFHDSDKGGAAWLRMYWMWTRIAEGWGFFARKLDFVFIRRQSKSCEMFPKSRYGGSRPGFFCEV